jgi:tetratricopeptide (TPR) repeat protein
MRYSITFLLLLSCHTILYAQEPILPETRENNTIKELFFAGLKDKLVENYSKASISFNKIIEIDPKNGAAYFELATLNYRQKKLLEAETFIKKAISLDPKNIWYLRLQSEIYKRNGNMEALIGVLGQLSPLDPENADFYFDLANAYLISGKTAEAQKTYTDIENKFGASDELNLARQRLTTQDSGISNAEVSKLLAENPTNIKNYLYLSSVLLEKNKKEDALALLQKAKAIAPDNFEIDLAMADIYQSQKKNELAIVPLKSAFANASMPVADKIKIVNMMLPRFGNATVVKDATELTAIALRVHPEEAKLLILGGDVHYQQGNLNAALTQYQAALKISDQLYIAWEKLIGVQTLLGQYVEAIKTGEEALSIYPNQAILYYYRAFALHRNGQNGEAGIEIKSALQLDSEDINLKAMIFALQAEVLIDQEKLKEADIAFEQAISLAPQNYLTLSNYAYYLALRNQNLGKAEMLASKAASALPNNASVLDTYAIVLFKLSKYEQALAYMEKALQNNEASNPVYLEHYGDILFLKGEKEKALMQWQKAKQAGNKSEKLIKKINEKKYIK